MYDVRRSDRVDQEMTLAFDFSIEEIAPLGIAYPDTVRLWHVCWLAHRSLPYVFTAIGDPWRVGVISGKLAGAVRSTSTAPVFSLQSQPSTPRQRGANCSHDAHQPYTRASTHLAPLMT